jgi:hypothetical protein
MIRRRGDEKRFVDYYTFTLKMIIAMFVETENLQHSMRLIPKS